MVEMLGVLAIMGVLSIGALIGIRSALDTHKANSIINEVNRRAVVWTANKSFGQSFDSFASDSLGYTWANPQDKDSYIELAITGIEPNVCTKIHRDDWSLVHVNTDCSLFQFKSDASVGTETATCGPCATANPVSGSCDDNDALCPSGQNCQNGFCSSCGKGSFARSDGVCLSCSSTTVTTQPLSADECHRCIGIRFYSPSVSRCTLCTQEKGGTNEQECFTCSDTYYAAYYPNRDTCFYCDPNYGVLNHENRTGRSACTQTSECPDGFVWMAGHCRSCSTEDVGAYNYNDYEQAKRCFGIYNTVAKAYRFWDGASRRLLSCADARDTSSTKEGCLVCNQPDSLHKRYWDASTQKCRYCGNKTVSEDGTRCD